MPAFTSCSRSLLRPRVVRLAHQCLELPAGRLSLRQPERLADRDFGLRAFAGQGIVASPAFRLRAAHGERARGIATSSIPRSAGGFGSAESADAASRPANSRAVALDTEVNGASFISRANRLVRRGSEIAGSQRLPDCGDLAARHRELLAPGCCCFSFYSTKRWRSCGFCGFFGH